MIDREEAPRPGSEGSSRDVGELAELVRTMRAELARAEEALRRAAAADLYRAALGEALREGRDPAELVRRGLGLLRELLDVNRAWAREVDGDEPLVVHVPDEPADDLALERAWRAALEDGQPVVGDDAVAVPLIRGGRLVALFGVRQRDRRAFTAHEVTLVQETAERAWTAVERARAERRCREQQGRAEEALRESDRRKDEFLAVLSHELRNPLAPIRTSAHVLRKAPQGSEAAERAGVIMERQIAHLTRLVEDLLDVTRIARGKIRLRQERVELGEVVRQTVEDHRADFAAKLVALEATVTTEHLWVEGDPTRLRQIVGNLLQNAAKFTDPGGRVVASLEAADGQALLRVEDTGVGIPEDFVASVFEPFLQAERTLARSRGGLGLGLALVKGLVELHGGEVEVHSEGPGRGSVFGVRLPLAARPSRPTDPDPSRPARTPRRILLVEDNRDGAEMLRMALELHGHRVDVAHLGAEGLRRAEDGRPDLVLCDIGLPDLSGYEVARELRSRPDRPTLVALTGYGMPEDARRAAEAGFDHHLTKPPDLERLLGVVGTAPLRAEPGQQERRRA